jgi:hypothetical protein
VTAMDIRGGVYIVVRAPQGCSWAIRAEVLR